MSKEVPFTPNISQPSPWQSFAVQTSIPTHQQPAQDANINTWSHILPATYRTSDGYLQIPNTDADFLRSELEAGRLNEIHSWLWLAGRPMPPRALHHQRLLGRDIVVTERMDMHLIWSQARIFVKPLPQFLLEPLFWDEHLSCKGKCTCASVSHPDAGCSAECAESQLRKCALGFLLSYAALISHESDFYIAKDCHLLPSQTSWMQWKTLAREILECSPSYDRINQRYVYGELRLNRLNAIYRLTGRAIFRGYQSEYSQYSSFIRDNLTWLATALAYVIIVLTAMQVGLATEALGTNDAFQAVSYGFTVFAMVAPLAAVMMVLVIFLSMFVHNWRQALGLAKMAQRELERSRGGAVL